MVFSALSIAKGKCPSIPFIFISGNMGEDLAIETLKSGATDYVMKNRLSRLIPSLTRALQEATERAERLKAMTDLTKSHEQLRLLQRICNPSGKMRGQTSPAKYTMNSVKTSQLQQ